MATVMVVVAAGVTPVAVAGGQSVADPPPPSDAPPVIQSPPVGVLDLSVSGPAMSWPGMPITWVITASNSGAGDLSDVAVTGVLPPVVLPGPLPDGAERSGTRTTWRVPVLTGGQAVSQPLLAGVPRSVRGSICARAVARAASAGPVRSRACTALATLRRPATPVTG